jgi:hypothetical protein
MVERLSKDLLGRGGHPDRRWSTQSGPSGDGRDRLIYRLARLKRRGSLPFFMLA